MARRTLWAWRTGSRCCYSYSCSMEKAGRQHMRAAPMDPRHAHARMELKRGRPAIDNTLPSMHARPSAHLAAPVSETSAFYRFDWPPQACHTRSSSRRQCTHAIPTDSLTPQEEALGGNKRLSSADGAQCPGLSPVSRLSSDLSAWRRHANEGKKGLSFFFLCPRRPRSFNSRALKLSVNTPPDLIRALTRLRVSTLNPNREDQQAAWDRPPVSAHA